MRRTAATHAISFWAAAALLPAWNALADAGHDHGGITKVEIARQVTRGDSLRLVVKEIRVPRTKLDGSPWDADGSAPDVVVKLRVGEREITAPTQSAYKLAWNVPDIVTIHPGDSIRIEALDRDTGADDPIGTIDVMFRRGTGPLKLGGDAIEALVDIEPVDAWVIPEMQVFTVFALDDAWAKMLRDALIDFNRRLYDATDGRVRIASFVLIDPPFSVDRANAPGTIHVHAEWINADKELADVHEHPRSALACAHGEGRPTRPGHVHVAVQKEGKQLVDRLGLILVHEFAHAFLGLKDEYLSQGGAGIPACPDEGAPHCVMNAADPDNREFCRPDNHDRNRDTEQSKKVGTDCWSATVAVLHSDLGISADIPSVLRPGPSDPPEPKVFLQHGNSATKTDVGGNTAAAGKADEKRDTVPVATGGKATGSSGGAARSGARSAPPEPPRAAVIDLAGAPAAVRLDPQGVIQFAIGRAEILPGSFYLVDRVAEFLRVRPEVTLIEVGGHTDSTGSLDLNTRLSAERAESVRAYLQAKGVSPERLRAAGYGPARPIVGNVSAAGRALNRRVEFVVMKIR